MMAAERPRIGAGQHALASEMPERLDAVDTAVAFRIARASTAPGDASAWHPLAPPAPVSNAQPASVSAAPAARTTQPDTVTLARLADAAYVEGSPLPLGWHEATSKDMLAIGVRPADLISLESAFRARVYVDGTGPEKRFVVAFRGSTSGRGDWISNGWQAAGLRTDHYQAALRVGERLAQSGAQQRVTITGHSLGGGLAAAAALAAGRNAVTFNAAGLSGQTIADARDIAQRNGAGAAPDIRAYHVRGEVLSAIQDGGDRMLGALLGGVVGHRIADAPEAFGKRETLDPIRPAGTPWWRDTPVARHAMDYVLTGLGAR